MKKLLPLLFLLCLSGGVQAGQVPTFGNEQEALTYCNGGGVVWLDLASGRYVYKGSRFYGKGKNAVFVCETDAIQAGGHAAQGK